MLFFRTSRSSWINAIIWYFQCCAKVGFLASSLFGFGEAACAMSAPLRLPKLLGKKPQFECNKLQIKKHIGRGSFGEVFLMKLQNYRKRADRRKNELSRALTSMDRLRGRQLSILNELVLTRKVQ